MRASTSSSSSSLRGNGNHEPRNAGTNHGSQTIEPWSDSIRIPACPMDGRPIMAVGRRPSHADAASGDGRVGVLLAVARHVLGPRRAVPVAQLVAAGRVVVPAGGHRRRGRLGRRRRRRCGSGGAVVVSAPQPDEVGRCSSPTRCRSRRTGPTTCCPRRPASGAVPHPDGSLVAAGVDSAAADSPAADEAMAAVAAAVSSASDDRGAGALHVGRDVAARPARWRRPPSRQRTSRRASPRARPPRRSRR